MAEAPAPAPECQVRRRRSSGNPNLPLNLEVGFKVNECGEASQGTPSPCVANIQERNSTSALLEFRKKQQSFDIQIEECEEEEIVLESEDEVEAEEGEQSADRPVTPTPILDFAAKTVYTGVPQTGDFLKVISMQNDCLTDVSDAEDEEEE